MTNIVLPTFPALASGAIFIKGVANNGSGASGAQYITFAHSFQAGQLANGTGLSADFGSGGVPCQVDVKTRYADGSAAHAIVSVQAPAVAGGATSWGQFSPAAPPAGTDLSFPGALGSNTLSLELVASQLPDWTASDAEALGALIVPAADNEGGYTFQCTTGGVTGTTAPTWPQTVGASVTDGGTIWTNVGANFSGTLTQDLVALINGTTPNLWLNGPLAIEGRASAILYETLRVQIDMRAYADGTINADVMVANDIATTITSGQAAFGGTLAYTASLVLNGNVAYASPALQHYLYENWTWQAGTVPRIVNSSQDLTLQVIHDPNDFIAAQATQAYNTTLGVVEQASAGLGPYQGAQGFVAAAGFGEPLTNPSFNDSNLVAYSMAGVGGRPDIGLNDSWCCWWYVTQNSLFLATNFECAKVGGGIPWHFWSEETGDYITTDDSPYLWSEVGPGTYAEPYTPQYGGLTLLALTTTDPNWDIQAAHFPELVYLSYLTTGRRYFLDELNAVTAWVETSAPQSGPYRNYTQGLIMREGQVRAASWGMRNILYATYANPDGSVVKLYFRRMLDNNLYWFLTQMGTYQAIQGPECFGWYPNWSYGSALANWEESYLFSSLSMAAIMGHPIALQVCQWMANYFIGLFTNGSNDPPSGFPPAEAVVYVMEVFQDFGTGTGDGTSYAWGSQWLPAQTWEAIESLIQQSGISNISDGEVVWFAGTGGGSGAYGDYGQLLWITLANYITLGQLGASAALTTLQTMTAANGTNAPYIDDASWAGDNGQFLTMVVARALSPSRILPAAAAPSAAPINANPVVGGLRAAAEAMSGGTPANAMSGAVGIGALKAAGILAQGAQTVMQIDGSILFGSADANSISGSLTTNNAGDVLIAFVQTGHSQEDGIPSVSDAAGHTWSQRAVAASTGDPLYEFWAIAPSALSGDTITVATTGGSTYLYAIAFGVSGADTANPFDASSALPVTSAANSAIQVSTSNANDLIFGGYRGVNAAVGPGWGTVQAGDNMLVEYLLVSAAQTDLAIPYGGGTSYVNGAIADAIVAAVKPVALAGAPVIGPLAAAAALALPTYATLAASTSEAISQLESALGALGQWQAAMAAQAASIEAVLTGLA